MGEHSYRPLPTPPRMRWAVVRASRTPKPFALVLGLVLSVVLSGPIQRHVPMWALTLWFVVSVLMWWWRLVRVPVEPPRVRVAETDTLEEHRDLTDAGYVYDHEARVYRLDANEGGWEPQSNGVHGYTRWDTGELP